MGEAAIDRLGPQGQCDRAIRIARGVSNIGNIPGALPESPDASETPSSLLDVGATDQPRPMWPLFATLAAVGLAVLVVIYVIFRSRRK